MPKDAGHDHELVRDRNHTYEEHCENVIYNVAVSDAHKCEHKYHLHQKHAHCFACDNHYTSLHTSHEAVLHFHAATINLPYLVHALPLPQPMGMGISNKGPPVNS